MKESGIVVILDGTGPLDDRRYSEEFAFSFCRQIQRRTSQAEYFRGVPGEETVLGLLATLVVVLNPEVVRSQAGAGLDQIAHDRKFQSALGAKYQQRIFIAGHSRGGAAAIMLAKHLNASQPTPVPIEAMFLFDAVNMTAADGLGQVPSNVRYCYHAMRDPKFAMGIETELAQAERELVQAERELQALGFTSRDPMARPGATQQSRMFNEAKLKIEKAKAKVDLLSGRLDKTRSNRRNRVFNWGNCATEPADPTKTTYVYRKFMGSHGAIGGTPWPSEMFPTDVHCASQVREWMWPYLDKHGVFDIDKFDAYQRYSRTV